MPLNSKKKKRRDRAKGTDDAEDNRDEIVDKIEEQKIKKAKSKSAKKSAGGFIGRWSVEQP